MRYLFFTNTPAHVHLYKHAVDHLVSTGHEVRILGRDYGCTVDLLEYYGLPHVIYGRCETTKHSLFQELPRHYLRIARETRRFDPDLIFGIGGYAAHAAGLSRTRCILIIDSEPTWLDHAVSRPFANAILTPHAFQKELGKKHFEFAGFKESAYIHPETFEPDPSVRESLGVEVDEPYVIVRLNAFGSHHDVGHEGFTPERRRELVERLSKHARVFVSDEGEQLEYDGINAEPFALHPGRLHNALAEASLLVADTQTMVTEAALLGTPAVRSNSFVGEGDMGNFHELADAGLVHNVRHPEEAISTALRLLTDPKTDERWRRRRDTYIKDMVNLTEVIVDVAELEGQMAAVNGVSPRSSGSNGRTTPFDILRG